MTKQLACLSGSNGQQKAQGGYVRHILAGAPKRSHFSSSRRQIGNGHVSEVSSASGVNGTAKKKVCWKFFTNFEDFLIIFHESSDVERETSSNFTGQRFMHLTGGPASSDASSNSKSSLDNRQDVDPMQLGAQLLSFNESQLCSTFNLPPTRYLTIKTVLLSNPKISEIDPAEKVILKHLNNSGWIRKA